MNIVYVLVPLALLFGLGFTVAFIWATRSGQFDDLDTPAYRILIDDSANEEIILRKNPSKKKT